MAAMTLDELLTEMRLCERVLVVQLEPRDVRRWREALENGLAAVAASVTRVVAEGERELCAQAVERVGELGPQSATCCLPTVRRAAEAIRARGAGTPRGPELDGEVTP